MVWKNWGTGTEILERAKTAEPFNEEERTEYDGNKDPARALATMQEYADKLKRQKKHTKHGKGRKPDDALENVVKDEDGRPI